MGRGRVALVVPLTIFVVSAAGAVLLGRREAGVAILVAVAAVGADAALASWSKKRTLVVH